MFYYGKVSIRWVGSVENGEVLALWEPEQFLFQETGNQICKEPEQFLFQNVYKYKRY